MEEKIKEIVEIFKNEATKRLVGQENLVTDILMAFVAGGHVLLEGVPGLGKTLTVKTVAKMLGLDFKRIQFTPDLLPADITGTLIYEQNKGVFSVRKGPVFSNIILADEVNRAPAKVQSAMLEAMEERHVTIGEKTYELPSPFFVLATQNPHLCFFLFSLLMINIENKNQLGFGLHYSISDHSFYSLLPITLL